MSFYLHFGSPYFHQTYSLIPLYILMGLFIFHSHKFVFLCVILVSLVNWVRLEASH